MNPDEITVNEALDRRVAAAATEAAWRRRLVVQAEEELQQRRENLAAAEAALAAVDPIQRNHKLLTKALDAINELCPPDPQTVDLDADPRPAEDQAAGFFSRPGDYHQVRIEVPEATNAECVIKFTPEQQPLIIETLRQLRGALYARITITRLDIASNQVAKQDIPQVNESESVVIGDGPGYNIAEDFTLADRETPWAPAACPVDNQPCQCDRTSDGCQQYRQRKLIAHQYGVPIDYVQPAPSRTGDTAWTITPPDKPAAGRHRAPDHETIELSADPTRYVEAIHDATYRDDDQ